MIRVCEEENDQRKRKGKNSFDDTICVAHCASDTDFREALKLTRMELDTMPCCDDKQELTSHRHGVCISLEKRSEQAWG